MYKNLATNDQLYYINYLYDIKFCKTPLLEEDAYAYEKNSLYYDMEDCRIDYDDLCIKSPMTIFEILPCEPS